MATNNITFPIKNANGSPFHDLVLRKVVVDSVVMSLGDKITGDVYFRDNTLAVTMQEYIEYNDVRYILVNPPTLVREGLVSDNNDLKGMTKYSFEFYHPMCLLGGIPFSDVAVSSDEAQYKSEDKTFNWVGTGYDFIAKLNKNLQGTQWVVIASDNPLSAEKLSKLPGEIPSDKMEQEEKKNVLSFDNSFVSDALKTAYDSWKVPFVIDSLKRGEYTYIDTNNNTVDYYDEGKRFVILFGLPSNEIVNNETTQYTTHHYIGSGYVGNDILLPKGRTITIATEGAELLEHSGGYRELTLISGSYTAATRDMNVVIRTQNSDGVAEYSIDTPFVFQFGQGVGLKNNSRTPRNNKIITRIAPYGSEDNIPYGYPQIPWYGNPSWDYTINNTSGMQEVTLPDGRTVEAMSYPIYDGIVSGKWVKLIKHPFTRKHLMPTVYRETVFNKVSPYRPWDEGSTIPSYNQTLSELRHDIESFRDVSSVQGVIDAYNALLSALTEAQHAQGATTINIASAEGVEIGYTGEVRKDSQSLIHGYIIIFVEGGIEREFESVLDESAYLIENGDYDPEIGITDFYDATSSEGYPNPIVANAPSFESHQFGNIKPRLTNKQIVDAFVDDDSYGGYDDILEFHNDFVMASIRKCHSNGWYKEADALTDFKNAVETQTVGTQEYSGSEKIIFTVSLKTVGKNTFVKAVYNSQNFTYSKLVWTSLSADPIPPTWDDSIDEEGKNNQSYFKITLPVLDFDLYACASITQEMQINMRDGDCMGCTFTVQVDWDYYKNNFYDTAGNFVPNSDTRDYDTYPDSSQGQITVVVSKDTETFGTLLPSIYQQPKHGDTFVFLGISLPLSYITDAEEELDEAAKEYMLENNVYYYDYPLKFDEYFLATHADILSQMRNNTIVRFQFAQEPTKALYIKQMTVKYGDRALPQYSITLTDDVEIVLNQIGQVTDDVSRMRVQMGELQKYYSQNINREIESKLSRVSDDIAQGKITFQQGLNSLADSFFSGKIGSPQFTSGLYTGNGWRIDSLGNGEMGSLRVRSYLEVVELLINRLQAQEGDTVFTDNDQIDAVEEFEYEDVTYYILSLKEKWDGYFTAQKEGNIIKGIINTLAAKYSGVSNVTDAQSVEADGGNKYYTSWMLCVEIPEEAEKSLGRNQIAVVLYGDNNVPAGRNFPPCELMTIARWGCIGDPTDETLTSTEKADIERRQRSFCISTTDGRITKLIGVNKPILEQYNYGTTLGTIPDFIRNWSVASRLIDGRDYLYAQGIIVGDFIKVDIHGRPQVNFVDCGEWIDGRTEPPTVGKGIYLYNEYNETSMQWEIHRVWHNGSFWECTQHLPIEDGGGTFYMEPQKGSPYWKELISKGEDGVTTQTIYTRQDNPSKPSTTQSDNVPQGWTAEPQGVSSIYKNEWSSTRHKANGTWTAFSTPALYAHYAEDGTSVRIKGTAKAHFYNFSALQSSAITKEVGDVFILDRSDDYSETSEGDTQEGDSVPTVMRYVLSPDFTWTIDDYPDESEGYVVDGHLWVVNSSGVWVDVGQIQGPAGQDGNSVSSMTMRYAISRYGTTANDETPPVIYGSWSRRQPTPNATYRYLWQEVTTTYTLSETTVRYYLIAMRGDDGESSVRVDIDNESDIIACDSEGEVRFERTIVIHAMIYNGATAATTGVTAPAVTLAGISATPSVTNGVVTYSWVFSKGSTISSSSYAVSIPLTYNGITYTAVFTLTRIDAIATYQLQPSINAVSFAYANGAYTPSAVGLSCGYKKIDANGVTEYDGTVQDNLWIGGTAPYNIFYRFHYANGTKSIWYWAKDLPDSESDFTGILTIQNSTTYLGVEFAMSSADSYLAVALENIVDTEYVPIVKGGEKGGTGERGKTGRFFYYAGEWSDNPSVKYSVTDAEAPYFSYGTEQDGTPKYWVWIGANHESGISMHDMGTPSNTNTNFMLMVTDFKYLITEAIFSKDAHFGAAIINQDWFISTNGSINGAAFNNGAMYTPDSGTQSAAYTFFDPSYPATNKSGTHSVNGKTWSGYNFIPNYAVDLLTGETYEQNAHVRGEIHATSGTFSGELQAATGTFSGELQAATGTFKGELQAATGTFSGQVVIKYGNNDAIVIKGDNLPSPETLTRLMTYIAGNGLMAGSGSTNYMRVTSGGFETRSGNTGMHTLNDRPIIEYWNPTEGNWTGAFQTRYQRFVTSSVFNMTAWDSVIFVQYQGECEVRLPNISGNVSTNYLAYHCFNYTIICHNGARAKIVPTYSGDTITDYDHAGLTQYTVGVRDRVEVTYDNSNHVWFIHEYK